MSYNQSTLSREEQLRLWKEKKSEEKKKAKIEAPQRLSPCLSQTSAKSLVSRTPATRSRSAQTGPLTTRNSNTSQHFDKRGSRLHHRAHTPTVTVKEIEAPLNANSPFHNDSVSPLASICQNTPNGDGSAPRSTHSRDIRDGTETKDISRYNRRRRTDFSTLLLPIPSLREHMTQITISPANEPGLGKISPALSLSSQISSTGCKGNDHQMSSDDERNTLMTPESVIDDSKHSSGDNKAERLMDIDEENCITEWVEQDISPPVRSRRRNDSMGLLLPIPSLRNTLTPTDDDAFAEQENASPTGDRGSFHEIGLAAVTSLSPLEDSIRRRRSDRSRRSKGNMRNSRRYDSPTLLLPIPSLREEWTPTDDLTTMHSEVVPVREDLSHQKMEQATPAESSNFTAKEAASLPSWDASNSAVCGDSFHFGKSEHAEDNELSAKGSCEADVKEFSVGDTHNTVMEPSEVSYLSGNDEGTDQDSETRLLSEEYRQPAKLNGRTVLHSVSEEPPEQSMDQINCLKDQVDQLSVENKLLTGRMYKFRHDYEERITPFRDLFEQNTKLREENKKLLLLKSENNILKSQNKEIMEGVAMLEGQTMLAIQKALERQKTLEEERDQAKSRVEELERQLRDLLDR